MRNDGKLAHKVIAVLLNGKMINMNETTRPKNNNFVICCDFGDWSSFRTLAECEAQYGELENSGRPDGYYWVEER